MNADQGTARRNKTVYMAKLAEQAERYEEMSEYMKKIVVDESRDNDLTLEERNLLSVAYKNVIGMRRASVRVLASIEAKERGGGEERAALADDVSEYRAPILSEIHSICQDMAHLVDKWCAS